MSSSEALVAEPGRLRRSRPGTVRPAWRQPLGMIGIAIGISWLVIAIFAPVISPYAPDKLLGAPFQSPSWQHLFGTDELGRDILSRVLYGARMSVPLALMLVVLAMGVGSTLGAIAGYFGSWVDGAIMRTTDLFFAFPAIILALVVVAVLGRGIVNAMLAIAIVSWPLYARVVRGLVLSIGEQDFVWASRLAGSSARRALLKDVLPNVAGPVLVLGTVELGSALLLLASLSFLGLGAQAPTAEWGSMVATGTQYFQFWWIGTFPGLAIFTAVLAFNFLGDSLRDHFDPQTTWQAEKAE